MRMLKKMVTAYVVPIMSIDDNGDYKIVAQEYTTDAKLAKRYGAKARKVFCTMSLDDLLRTAKTVGEIREITEDDLEANPEVDEIMNEN